MESDSDIHSTQLYLAVDPGTNESFEFITEDFEAISEWIDQKEDRFYLERTPVSGEYVRSLL